MTDGRDILISGIGTEPTADQFELLIKIDDRWQEVIDSSIEAVTSPDVNTETAEFHHSELTLSEISVDGQDSFIVFLNTPYGDAINMWPMLTFSEWVVTKSEWVP